MHPSVEDQIYKAIRALGYTTSSQTLELVKVVKSVVTSASPSSVSESPSLDTKENWEKLARMSLAAMQMGVRIEQANGHRWIYADATSEWYRASVDPDKNPQLRFKQYGSFLGALIAVDSVLTSREESGLIVRSNDLDDYDDLGTLLGAGDVE